MDDRDHKDALTLINCIEKYINTKSPNDNDMKKLFFAFYSENNDKFLKNVEIVIATVTSSIRMMSEDIIPTHTMKRLEKDNFNRVRESVRLAGHVARLMYIQMVANELILYYNKCVKEIK